VQAARYIERVIIGTPLSHDPLVQAIFGDHEASGIMPGRRNILPGRHLVLVPLIWQWELHNLLYLSPRVTSAPRLAVDNREVHIVFMANFGTTRSTHC